MHTHEAQDYRISAPAAIDLSWHLVPVQDSLYERYGYSRTPPSNPNAAEPRIQLLDPSTVGVFHETPWDVEDVYPFEDADAAQNDYITCFIEEVLLPRMRHSKALTALELQRLTLEYKLSFSNPRSNDVNPEFEIIPAVEMQLLELYRAASILKTSPMKRDYVRLLRRALFTLKRLLDENPDELFLL